MVGSTIRADAGRSWPHVPPCAQIVREYSYAFAAASLHDGVLDSLVLPEV
ncbi:MAG: hypothetical protein ABIP64_08735 [Burkholderiales bacterium]